MNNCDIKCLAMGINKHIHKTEENRREGHPKAQAFNQ